MSERFLLAEPLRIPALALARWTVLLTGWVWLGAQGQRLGWSLAGGLLAVALWWSLRLVLGSKGFAPSRRYLLTAGLVTAVGAGWVGQAAVNEVSLAALMVLAALWAVWTTGLESLTAGDRRCQRPWAGWPPLVAALLAWGSVSSGGPLWGAAAWVVGVLLAAVALVCLSVPRTQAMARAGHAADWPQTAMGLMMGSLWLSSGWCASIGWSIEWVVGLHVALMAVLPGCVRLGLVPKQMPPGVVRALPLALVVAGGGLLALDVTAAHGWVGMVLLALAWAMPRRAHDRPAGGPLIQGRWKWVSQIGPVSLVAAGVWSPTLGPQALEMAYGAMAAFAGAALLRLVWGPMGEAPAPLLSHRSR